MSSIDALASSFIGVRNRERDDVVPNRDAVGVDGNRHATVADDGAIDARPVPRAQIGKHEAPPTIVDACVLPRHELIGQYDMVFGATANRDFGLENGDRMHFAVNGYRECILCIDGVAFGRRVDQRGALRYRFSCECGGSFGHVACAVRARFAIEGNGTALDLGVSADDYFDCFDGCKATFLGEARQVHGQIIIKHGVLPQQYGVVCWVHCGLVPIRHIYLTANVDLVRLHGALESPFEGCLVDGAFQVARHRRLEEVLHK